MSPTPFWLRTRPGTPRTSATTTRRAAPRRTEKRHVLMGSIEVPRTVLVSEVDVFANGNAERTGADIGFEMAMTREAQVIAMLDADHGDVPFDADDAEQRAG